MGEVKYHTDEGDIIYAIIDGTTSLKQWNVYKKHYVLISAVERPADGLTLVVQHPTRETPQLHCPLGHLH